MAHRVGEEARPQGIGRAHHSSKGEKCGRMETCRCESNSVNLTLCYTADLAVDGARGSCGDEGEGEKGDAK